MVEDFAVMESSPWSPVQQTCCIGDCEAMLEIDWPVSTGQNSRLGQSASIVEVWAALLDLPAEQFERCATLLSSSERERAARFHFQHHRNRFQAGRAFLRSALSRWLDVEPAQIEFGSGPNGKPELGGRFADCGLHFNLSHCDELALLAFSRLAPLGVDVERVRALDDADDLVARFFSPRENRAFQQLAETEKPLAFFNLWTRKEAWLKATGEGIGHLLNQVEVSFLPGQTPELLHVPKRWEPPGNNTWSLHQLTPARGFTAALAIAATDPQLHCRHWTQL